MQISKNNVRLQNNTFIDNIYDLYCELSNKKAFTEIGYESGGIKVWRYDDEYYILDKTTGILVTWHKLLGWNLETNTKLNDQAWIRFCERLKYCLDNNLKYESERD